MMVVVQYGKELHSQVGNKLLIQLSYAEFYITNHCNITCKNCNRFNNHKISGSADWGTYRDIYCDWSKLLNVRNIAILGGEPLLHPKLESIVTDVRQWWPASNIEITTNGLLINRLKPEAKQAIIDNNISVYVSIHKESWKESIIEAITNTFGNLTLLSSDRPRDPHASGGCDTFVSAAGNKIFLEYTYYFRESSLIKSNEKLTLHNSNPEKAHSECDMKYSFHFWKGFLYKCGVMVTLPYMIEQKYNLLDITQEQQDLLKKYKPLSIEDVRNNPELIRQLHKHIDQCRFCPESYADFREKIFED